MRTFWKRLKAMWHLAPVIEGASRVVILSDDCLVIEYPHALSLQATTNIEGYFRSRGFPKTLVLTEGAKLRTALGLREAP